MSPQIHYARVSGAMVLAVLGGLSAPLDYTQAHSTAESPTENFAAAHSPIVNPSNPNPRIVGGEPAEAGAYSWIAALRFSGGHFCGGALIRADWVLTAAHCVEGVDTTDPSGLDVLIGTVNLADGEGEVIQVERIVLHPDWDATQVVQDLALLKLSQPSAHQPVNLVPPGSGLDGPGALATVLGWGLTDPQDEASSTDLLQQVSIPVSTDEACEQTWGQAADTLLCAGAPEGGKDSCFGDSGGPLFVSGTNGEPLHAGVVSFGEGCALPNAPGGYARVSTNVAWIQSVAGSAIPTPDPDTCDAPVDPDTSTDSTQNFNSTIEQEFHEEFVPESGFTIGTEQRIQARLSGPDNTDFNLWLQRRVGNRQHGVWETVAMGTMTNNASTETINYQASAGTYRFSVFSVDGLGEFTTSLDLLTSSADLTAQANGQ